MSTSTRSSFRAVVQWSGLLGGPMLALLAGLLLPDRYMGVSSEVVFSAAGKATLAMMIWMALWWLTEAVDIEVTALLPLAMFPLLGVASIKAAAAPYADDTIFLFMGGFLLALSMQRWGLDRRIALITLRMVGTKPANMVAGFMMATATLSAFVSNTATAAMMLPIAMSVVALVRRRLDERAQQAGEAGASEAQAMDLKHLALSLMLGIAYAASIGGIATIIGTPPNVILVGFLRDKIEKPFRLDVGFGQWLMIGAPLVIVFLPLTWLLLTRFLFPVRMERVEGGRELIDREYRALGKADRGEWITFIVFMIAATLWITRPWLTTLGWGEGADRVQPLKGLSDAGIGMLAALALFVTPTNAKAGEFTLNWATAVKLPWGILILFGGGLSLAAAVQSNGVAEYIGSQARILEGASPLIVVLVVTTMVTFLTELTSNTATTAALLPVMAALAPGFGVHPYLLVFPTCMAASCAFMLPVATPPNAIVFATGHVTIPQMCKAGIWLKVISIVLVVVLTMTIIGPVLGVKLY